MQPLGLQQIVKVCWLNVVLNDEASRPFHVPTIAFIHPSCLPSRIICLSLPLYIIMYKAKENGKSEKQQPVANRVEG